MKIAVCLLLLCAAQSCAAWGWQGHQIVAYIANGLLNPTALAKVNDILANDKCGPAGSFPCRYGTNLTGCASWADDIKRDADWAWTSPVHYVDTPDHKELKGCDYKYARDCYDHNYDVGKKDLCVTGGINNATTQLKQGTSAIIPAACSVKFLTHYVGDVHQPLHVGFTSDRGGNLETTKFLNRSGELHGIWDSSIIQELLATEYASEGSAGWSALAADLLKTVTPAEQTAWTKVTVDGWAEESIEAACADAYRTAKGIPFAFKNDTELTMAYYDKNVKVIKDRLTQGGVRLAFLLNDIFPKDIADVVTIE